MCSFMERHFGSRGNPLFEVSPLLQAASGSSGGVLPAGGQCHLV